LKALVLVPSGLSFVLTALHPSVVYGEDFLGVQINNLSLEVTVKRNLPHSLYNVINAVRPGGAIPRTYSNDLYLRFVCRW
jgi:hypothetical protein